MVESSVQGAKKVPEQTPGKGGDLDKQRKRINYIEKFVVDRYNDFYADPRVPRSNLVEYGAWMEGVYAVDIRLIITNADKIDWQKPIFEKNYTIIDKDLKGKIWLPEGFTLLPLREIAPPAPPKEESKKSKQKTEPSNILYEVYHYSFQNVPHSLNEYKVEYS